MAQPKKPEKVKENPDESPPDFITETANVLMDTEESLENSKDPVWYVAETLDKTEGLLENLAESAHKKNPEKIPPYPYKRERADA